MNDYVLDASALLALLNEEEGSDVVLKHLAHSATSTVNIAETASVLVKNGMSVDEAKDVLESVVNNPTDFSQSHAYSVASLYEKTAHLGLSPGDRACLSLAILNKASVITADKIWSKLKLPIKVIQIR